MMVDSKRRAILQSGLLIPAMGLSTHSQANEIIRADINIILPAHNPQVFSAEYAQTLAHATLDYLVTEYTGKNLPVWHKPLAEIDLEPRLASIAHWVVQAVEEHRQHFYVDPVWVMSQIMAESYFYEFAISSSLAMGICQFILPTAHDYKLTCAGDDPSHHTDQYQHHALAKQGEQFYIRRKARSQYRKIQRHVQLTLDKDMLETLAFGDAADYQEAAKAHLESNQKMAEHDALVKASLTDFRQFLHSNLDGRNILDPTDRQFVMGLDERLTYQKPISAMVKMLAWALKKRHGNLLAAAAGYNSGLGRTKDTGFYQRYGRIPTIEETVKYLSHIVVNHHEIQQRMG